MAQYTRQAAVPCTLKEISDGVWEQHPGFEPSGVRTPRGMISRCSVMGVLVDKQESNLAVDDGTHIISVRSFDPVPVYAQVGDMVHVVGRPREYNGERYLVLEICKRIKNPAWVQYRKRELEQLYGKVTQAPKTPIPVEVDAKNPFETIVGKIRELDHGTGADVDEVIAAAGLPDANKLLQTLMEEGEIFEIKPGRVKVLE